MQSVIQISAEAARQIGNAQALVSHNLANAGTTAFKADLYQARSEYIRGGDLDSAVTTSSHGQGVDYSPGNIAFTGRELDVAITGPGWMKVVTPQGEEILSRRGDLHVDTEGRLMDAVGNQILGNRGPIALPPFSSLTIGNDGTMSLVPVGEAVTNVVAIDRIMLVNADPKTLTKGLDGNIRSTDIATLEPDANVQLNVGALETSNVNPINAMVQMIELSRAFEGHVQAMKSSEELDTSSASLMSLE